MSYTDVLKALKEHIALLKALGVVAPSAGFFLSVEGWCQTILDKYVGPLWQLRILLILLSLCFGLATYIYLKRPKFVEHYGAHFKKNNSGYHQAVYCGDPKCLAPTYAHPSSVYICKCGWKANFGRSSLGKIMEELP